MAAVITNIISADNWELIRDQLAGMIFVELTEQAVLDNTFTAPTTVWMERFVQFNAPTETPYVNVRYQSSAQYENSREPTQSKYLHTYFIEASVKAKSTSAATGDKLAAVALHKLLRKIRGILANPLYNKLGLSIPIGRRYINSIEVFEPMETENAMNLISGHIEFCVDATEQAYTPPAEYPLNWITTTAKMNETEVGYYWVFRQMSIAIVTTGATLTNSFFTNPITEIEIGSIAYVAGVDFTQTGTTITAVTFTFTSGTTIVAKT